MNLSFTTKRRWFLVLYYWKVNTGESDLCIGVPVILGKNGIEKIVELDLNADEKAKFAASAAAVHKTNAALKEVGAL